MNPADGFSKQAGYRKHFDFIRFLYSLFQRDGVGNDQLFHTGVLYPVHGCAREHRMRDGGKNSACSLLQQGLYALDQSAGCSV